MLEKDPERRPKISEILEKKEIKLEVRKLLEKHPKIYCNFIESQPLEIKRDNKSISFHDYLIKKRNSLADDEENEAAKLTSNIKLQNNKDSTSKKPSNHQCKLSAVHMNNHDLIPSTILSRKISLPNDVPSKNLDNSSHINDINKCYIEKPTVKNTRNELNTPLQAYFFNNKTPNVKNNQYNNNNNNNKVFIGNKNIPYQLKTPQHNNNQKNQKGCFPNKKVINLNLDNSNIYYQENRPESSRILNNNNLEESILLEENTISYSENPMKIKPIISISPKYSNTPVFDLRNKENIGLFSNKNDQFPVKNSRNNSKKSKKESFHEINVSFEDFSRQNLNIFKQESTLSNNKQRESTKRSISVYISSKEQLENMINPQKASNFSEFLKQKQEKKEKTPKEQTSFVDFLQKRKETRKTEAKKEGFIDKNSKKQEILKDLMVKMLGEEKFKELMGMLLGIEGKFDAKSIEKINDLMGGGNRETLLMMREIWKK